MSESNDAPPPPPSDEPSSSPFPDSSLTPPPAEPPPLPPESPPSPPPAPHGDPVAPEPPAYEAPAPPASTWLQPPSAPEPTAPSPAPWSSPDPTPAAPPPSGGMMSGDPLGGSTGSAFPSGYTSPPPPGAGSDYTSPPPAAFGSGTPAAGTFVLAGWWRRVGAAIIDGLIILVPFLLIVSVLGVGFFGDDEGTSDGAAGFIVGFILSMLVFVVIALLYAPLMMSRTNGKTVGRMATGIRVVQTNGNPITFGFAALREIVVKGLLIQGVGGSLTFGLAWVLDSLWPLWDDENRALHDFIVNTRTVMDS